MSRPCPFAVLALVVGQVPDTAMSGPGEGFPLTQWQTVIAALITVAGGIAVALLGRRKKKETRGQRAVQHPVATSGAAINTRKLLNRKVRLLERLLDLRSTWGPFEEKLGLLLTLFEQGSHAGAEFRETCDALDTLRDKLRSHLLEIRPEIPYMEGSAAELNTAERKLLQFGFRGARAQRFLSQYDHVNEYQGVAWFDGDTARREARDAGIVIEVTLRRLRTEVEELFEEVRTPGEPPPKILLKTAESDAAGA